jgi:hypothetical protein
VGHDEQVEELTMGVESAIMGMSAASTASGAMGSIFNGSNAKKLAKYNAKVATMQADDAIVRGKEAEYRQRQSVRGMIGAQRAAFAGQGVDVNDGSALEVQMDTAKMGALDAVTIRNNAAREAFGYQAQASGFKMQGQAAASEGVQGAFGTILGGASNAAMLRYYMGPAKGVK